MPAPPGTVPVLWGRRRAWERTASTLGLEMHINKDFGIAAGLVTGALTIVQVLITTVEALARHG